MNPRRQTRIQAGPRAFLWASAQETEVLLVCGPQLMRPWRQKVNLGGSSWVAVLGFLRCQSTTLGKLFLFWAQFCVYWGSTLLASLLSYGDGGQEYSVAFKLPFQPGSFLPAHLSLSSSQSLVSLWSHQADSVCLFQDLFKAFTLFRHQLVPWFGPSSLYLVVTLPLATGPEDTWAFPELGSSAVSGWEPSTDWKRHLTFVTSSREGIHSLSFTSFTPARQLFGCGEKVSFLNLMGSTFILGVCFVFLMDCPFWKFVAGPHSSKGWLTWWYPQRWLFC